MLLTKCSSPNTLATFSFLLLMIMTTINCSLPCSWYHGRLDRAASEDRLRLYGKLGAYLIRESDRRPGSYVLSYHGRSGVSHFKWVAFGGVEREGGWVFKISLTGYLLWFYFMINLGSYTSFSTLTPLTLLPLFPTTLHLTPFTPAQGWQLGLTGTGKTCLNLVGKT